MVGPSITTADGKHNLPILRHRQSHVNLGATNQTTPVSTNDSTGPWNKPSSKVVEPQALPTWHPSRFFLETERSDIRQL
jgi:hypothetical protein